MAGEIPCLFIFGEFEKSPPGTPIITRCSVHLSSKTMIHHSYSLCKSNLSIVSKRLQQYCKITAPNIQVTNVNGKIKVTIPTLKIIQKSLLSFRADNFW